MGVLVKRLLKSIVWIAAVISLASAEQQARKPVTLDDLFNLRSIVDVKISPQGNRVAYVVSKPSLAKNQHEASLFVIAAGGGEPRRLAESTRILNTPLPAPKLRWSPDGTRIAFLAISGQNPQVFAVDASGGEAKALTDAPDGAMGFEWSPDGQSVAYLTRDPMSAEEQRQRQDSSFVTHVDAPDRATRIALQPLAAGAAPRFLTPANQYVENMTWSPDGREIAYSAAPTTGFMAQYAGRI